MDQIFMEVMSPDRQDQDRLLRTHNLNTPSFRDGPCLDSLKRRLEVDDCLGDRRSDGVVAF